MRGNADPTRPLQSSRAEMMPQSCPEWGEGASPSHSCAGQLRRGHDPVSGCSLSWAQPAAWGLNPSFLKGMVCIPGWGMSGARQAGSQGPGCVGCGETSDFHLSVVGRNEGRGVEKDDKIYDLKQGNAIPPAICFYK